MVTSSSHPLEDRLAQLLRHLGIERAHFAGCMSRDWEGLVNAYPDLVASLTLITPMGINVPTLAAGSPPLLIFSGDRGRPAEDTKRAVDRLPGAKFITLPDYFGPSWADAALDRQEEIGAAMLDFLRHRDREGGVGALTVPESNGELADISFHIRGAGSPLILLPLGLAPSQWDPLLPILNSHHCTITLGGPALGMVAHLEARAQSGYMRIIDQLFHEINPKPGEVLLEVGCGSGAVVRLLAQRTGGRNRIVAADVNRYLLREATNITKKQGLEHAIEFREGNAEQLPFADNHFDATLSCTVMEEGDADRMLSELVRVTRPGGRIAVVVRSTDLPRYVNLPLPGALKRKVESPGLIGGSVQERGCADASLYHRMSQAGIVEIAMLPQWATHAGGERLQYSLDRILAALTFDEARQWQDAVARAQSEGNFFITEPFHCAVGTKP